MAPGATQIVVGGDSCNQGDFGLQGLFDADLAVLSGPLATVASNSWESGLESQPAVLTNIEHAFLVQAAAEGVGMYFSSGDGSGVLAPSSDPYAIAVGGTTLGIGKGRTRLFETGWSTGRQSCSWATQWYNFGEDGAAGGGPSLLWTEPVLPGQRGAVQPDPGGGRSRRAGPLRAGHQRGRGRVHRLRHGPAHVPRQQAAHLQPDPGRRDQPGGTAGGRHGHRGAAGAVQAVRVHQPGAVQPGRDHRGARHPAAEQPEPGRVPGRRLFRRAAAACSWSPSSTTRARPWRATTGR